MQFKEIVGFELALVVAAILPKETGASYAPEGFHKGEIYSRDRFGERIFSCHFVCRPVQSVCRQRGIAAAVDCRINFAIRDKLRNLDSAEFEGRSNSAKKRNFIGGGIY